MGYPNTNEDSFHNSDDSDDGMLSGMQDAIGFGEGGNDPLSGGSQTEEITTHRDPETGEFESVQMDSVTVTRGPDGEFAETDDSTDGFLSKLF